MIRLNRNINHFDLNQNFYGSDKIRNDLELVESLKKTDSIQFRHNIWQSASDNLKTETAGKCGFCEEILGTHPPELYSPTVDHFRPKGKRKYRHLAYSYFNLIIACKKCNVNHKKGEFDILGTPIKAPKFKLKYSAGQGSVTFANLAPDPFDIFHWNTFKNKYFNKAYRRLKAQEKREKPLFINPYFDNPKDFFGYEIIKINKVKSIIIRPLHTNGQKWKRANYTIDRLGLNNDDLSLRRYEEFKLFMNKYRSIKTSSKSKRFKKEKWSGLKEEYTANNHRFAGMFRFFVKDIEKLNSVLLDKKWN